MKIKLSFLTLLLLILISCKKKQLNNHDDNVEHEKHWSYEGETSPEHWAEIEKNSDCDGQYQSPINIIETEVIKTTKDINKLDFFYSPITNLSHVKNNGHSIEYDFDLGDSINYNNHIYHLKQVHFHEPSEHTINGVRYPIEIHLVHAGANNEYTVLSIFGEEGERNDLLNFNEERLPSKINETKEINLPIDLRLLIPSQKHYFSYAGSLTTPPCSETVNWVIFKQPVHLSVDAVLRLKDIMPINNYRTEQPINKRVIYYNSFN